MPRLDDISTIIIVMMENRSFDHMLGYLKRDLGWNIDGLRPGNIDANSYNGQTIPVHHFTNPLILTDPEHERSDVREQLGTGTPGQYPMDGFVKSFSHHHNIDDQTPVMGYYTTRELPLYAMFAEQFAICDKWFSPLPTSTHPNRMMALTGSTLVGETRFQMGGIPHDTLVYEWLTEKGVEWGLYYEHSPIFPTLLQYWPDFVPETRYRKLMDLARDLRGEGGRPVPEVVFLEPTYTDAPHLPFVTLNDDHPPTLVTAGQRFVSKVYQAATSSPDQWKRSVMLVTYDEHGGFYDHVSPLALRYDPPRPDLFTPFESTGPRVPAFVISPFVSPKLRYSAPLDHTSILHFLGQKFGGGKYSDAVTARQADGHFGSVMEVLDRDTARTDIPRAPAIPDLPVPTEDVMLQLQRKRDQPADMHVLSALTGFGLRTTTTPPKARKTTKRRVPKATKSGKRKVQTKTKSKSAKSRRRSARPKRRTS